MEGLWLVVTGVAAVTAAGTGTALVLARRELAAARAEARQLREMVKKRVERPNAFSHEVRTPLTLIKGAAELLAEESPGPLTQMQREFVTTIAVNAQRVIDLAQDLLAKAKIDAQLFELHLESLDLRALARETVREARSIQVTPLRLDSSGPALVLRGDRKLLGQALWNLVNNACRHAQPGTTVTVSVSEAEGQAIVAVSDDGVGMSEDERADLFTPFVSSSGEQGTGLGMALTNEIVTQHGGKMLVDTIPERGTTVFITLPLREPDPGGGRPG